MKFKCFLIGVGLMLVLFSYSFAQVPQMINYQGKLTKASGAVLDTTISMVFSIYADSSGAILKWTETQGAVVVDKGIFNVLLGSTNPIPDTVFDGSIRYLGVTVGADPEITPRKPMVSVPYAYRSAFGGGSINCHDCDSIFVNVNGPDSVVATEGSAFLGKVSGSSTDRLYGVRGYAQNTSSGDAYGGYFTTSSEGTGDHYGVEAYSRSNSNGTAYGIKSSATNESSGDVYAGYFQTFEEGTGERYGLRAIARSNSSSSAYGTKVTAGNYSSGNAYGGYFDVEAGGTGTHYGVTGFAGNTSSGGAYGGYFTTSSEGTGEHYGLKAEGYGASNSTAYGTRGYAGNTSSGDAIGGSFSTSSSGTGDHYGVKASANSNSNGGAYGINCSAYNYSSGDAYGGRFSTFPEGTGERYGVRASGSSNSSSSAYGIRGEADNYSSGNAYGGYFNVAAGGSGTHYGVYGQEQAGGTGAAVYAAGDFAGSGAKYAVTKTSKGHRLMSVIESPEVWFEDFGEGQLINGKTHIELDPLFLETVTINELHPMKVFIQLKDDCEGTYVKTFNTGFNVFELQSGTSNATFSYRVVAKRKGYETERLKETDVGKDDPNLYPELKTEIEKKHQEERSIVEEERKRREDDNKKREEESLKAKEENELR